MSKEIELWRFIADRLKIGERIVLLAVAESHGSSPGRAGYKMTVAENGELVGSIGGGVMEVKLVERAKQLLSEPPTVAVSLTTELIEQDHRENSDHPSGMICSGRQTVILKILGGDDLSVVERIIDQAFDGEGGYLLLMSRSMFTAGPDWCGTRKLEDKHASINFEIEEEDRDFTYSEELDLRPRLYIVGGGHCSLALSELMSRMRFQITIFDDRPELNTLAKNQFADEIIIIKGYDSIARHLEEADDAYVVVMTLGYKTDEIVVRNLLDRKFKYFGVLGSRAKMATLLRELKTERYPQEQLDAIRTPIGIPINSHTPEEIAISIAAEIISVKNA